MLNNEGRDHLRTKLVWRESVIRSGIKAPDCVREQGVPRIENERTPKYVSISICGTTQLSDDRWGFDTTSNHDQGNFPRTLCLYFSSLVRISFPNRRLSAYPANSTRYFFLFLSPPVFRLEYGDTRHFLFAQNRPRLFCKI